MLFGETFPTLLAVIPEVLISSVPMAYSPRNGATVISSKPNVLPSPLPKPRARPSETLRVLRAVGRESVPGVLWSCHFAGHRGSQSGQSSLRVLPLKQGPARGAAPGFVLRASSCRTSAFSLRPNTGRYFRFCVESQELYATSSGIIRKPESELKPRR